MATAFITFFERKKIASFQHRRGPNNIGFLGICQPISDALKLLFKEVILPKNSIFIIFIFSPILASFFGFLNWVLYPFTSFMANISDLNLGVLFFFAVSSLHIYSIMLAGWSSNSRYSFLGAVRSSAQLIAYDIALSTIFLNLILITKTFNLNLMITYQFLHGSLIYYYFFLFLLFFICIVAETNRHPFDLPEAESELVSGYNVEYSSINFALFFLGEYTSILFMSFFTIILFFGGWLSIFYYIKVFIILSLFILLRTELPRYRYDQLMDLGWKIILPFSLYMFIWNFFLLLVFDYLKINFIFFIKNILYY